MVERPTTSDGTATRRTYLHKKRRFSISTIPLNPHASEPSSRADTPVEGLNSTEARLLRKHFDTGSEIVEAFRHVLEEYTGGSVNDDKLKISIQRVIRGAVFSPIVNELMCRTPFIESFRPWVKKIFNFYYDL